jgi:hypothetical protein
MIDESNVKVLTSSQSLPALPSTVVSANSVTTRDDTTNGNNDDDVNNTITSETFQHTALGFDNDEYETLDPVARTKLLKLPNGYDVVAIRETLLSEAPFVSRGNKAFWRRMMDNSQFVDILTCSYHHILACISDSGVVYEDRLVDIQGPMLESISNNFADVYFGISRHERDLFIPKLPELLCFMAINALQAAAPKHQRLYMSNKFREIIIDWGTELFSGVRQSHTKLGKEWIFRDCNEMKVMTTNKPSKFTQKTADSGKRKKTKYPLNSIGSKYMLDHSPLISMYIERNNPSCNLIQNKLWVTLSHFPSRPLTTLQPGLLKSVKFRERKIDNNEIKQVMKRSNSMRRTIMTELDVGESNYRKDMARMKEALKTKLRVLNNVKISKKEEYEMKAAMSLGATFNTEKTGSTSKLSGLS